MRDNERISECQPYRPTSPHIAAKPIGDGHFESCIGHAIEWQSAAGQSWQKLFCWQSKGSEHVYAAVISTNNNYKRMETPFGSFHEPTFLICQYLFETI
ncbi:hypothetical protein E4T56_gene16302 [Termitomyces sp. T112]|nr:hypothetical protein E4T56_gene16302 [Termitomyces sp. T112]